MFTDTGPLERTHADVKRSMGFTNQRKGTAMAQARCLAGAAAVAAAGARCDAAHQ